MENENNQDNQVNEASSSDDKKPMNMMVYGGVLVAAVVLIGGYMVMRSRSTQDITTTITPTSAIQKLPTTSAQKTANGATGGTVTPATQSDVTVVNVEGGSFYYKPNEIKVKKGEKVKIVFKAVDMMHDFVIDDLNVKTKIIKSGETTEVEFAADKVGEYEFYCSVGQHRANGMVGTLIVE